MIKEKTQKTAILVVGMHRSGTSALTRVLSLLGCSLPKSILGPGLGNESGHWESKPVLALNDEILQSTGSSWNDWKALNQSYLDSSSMNQLREKALDILDEQYGSSQLFIIKDPRICRLLPFWLDVLKHFDTKPLIISPIRNPLDVAASLKTRDQIDFSISLLIWLRYILDAEFYSRGLKRTYLRFEDLFIKPQNIVNRLSEVLEINWPKRYSSFVDVEIKKFLQLRLHHHHSDDIDVCNNQKLPQWIRSSFEILNKWSHEKIILTDEDKLDQIRTTFNEVTLLFDKLISEQEATISKQKTTISEQEATISRLLNSRSYRITIPLRYLMKFMRKLKSKIHS